MYIGEINGGVYLLFVLILLSALIRLSLSTAQALVHARDLLAVISGYIGMICCGTRHLRLRRKAKLLNTIRHFLTVPYLRNLLDWFISIASIVLTIVWIVREGIPNYLEWQVAVVLAFINWAHFILRCDKLPIIGTYVVMFTKILRTFLKVSIFGLLLILMFSVVLVALFNELIITVSYAK